MGSHAALSELAGVGINTIYDHYNSLGFSNWKKLVNEIMRVGMSLWLSFDWASVNCMLANLDYMEMTYLRLHLLQFANN